MMVPQVPRFSQPKRWRNSLADSSVTGFGNTSRYTRTGRALLGQCAVGARVYFSGSASAIVAVQLLVGRVLLILLRR